MSNPLSNQGQPYYEQSRSPLHEPTELPNPSRTRYVGVMMEAITTYDRFPNTEEGLTDLFGLRTRGAATTTQALSGRVASTVFSPSAISNDHLVSDDTPRLQPHVEKDKQVISYLVGLTIESTRSLMGASSKRKLEEIQVDKEKQSQEAQASASQKRLRPMFPASSKHETFFSEPGAEDDSPVGVRVAGQPNYSEKSDYQFNEETFSLLSQLSNSNSKLLNDLKSEVPGGVEGTSYGASYLERKKLGN